MSILATVAIYTYILKNQTNNHQKEAAELKDQIAILNKESKEQADKNKALQQNVADLTVSVDIAKQKTVDALAVLNQLKKPISIDTTDTVEEVKIAIKTNYNDETVIFDDKNQKFNIDKNTTISIIDQPGSSIYKHDGNCHCGDSSSNSFIISSNKFEPETPFVNGTKIQNNALITNPNNYLYILFHVIVNNLQLH